MIVRTMSSPPLCLLKHGSKILLGVMCLILIVQYSLIVRYDHRFYQPPASVLKALEGPKVKSKVTTSTKQCGGPGQKACNASTTQVSTAGVKMANCPAVPPLLGTIGPVNVSKEAPSMEELERRLQWLEPGGRFRPRECRANHRVAFIVPFRDRAEHLRIFLANLHPILKRQQIDYGIYVVEQAGHSTFNKARMMNAGFLEALQQYDWQCFIFHDVDLIPEDDRNLYTCPEQPRHMSVAVSTFDYQFTFAPAFGGVTALTKEQFLRVNGYSNMYWGWGGEDDDMSNRIRSCNYTISRYPEKVARYLMLKHKHDTNPNPKRFHYLRSSGSRIKTDGLSTLKYERLDIITKKLYTWIFIKIPEQEPQKGEIATTDGERLLNNTQQRKVRTSEQSDEHYAIRGQRVIRMLTGNP